MNHTAVARRHEPSLGLNAKLSHGYPGRLDVLAHAFLGKVECHLEARDDINKPGLKTTDRLGEPAPQRTRRQPDGTIGPRAGHQRDGPGLRPGEAGAYARPAREPP